MNEALELEVGHRVLEVGAGSGWHACTVAEIVAPTDVPRMKWGHVHTVEIVSRLAERARENIAQAGFEDRVTVICGDGSMGYVEEAPFDRILVTAAAPEVPKPLIEQLKKGGVLVIPVGGSYFFQSLVRVRKGESGKISQENLGGVAFVPLTGKYGHRV
ncbi:MAG: methyltransferase domain-containing protein [Thermoproteota archaeon]|nr:methyltransferase domain-containing protein [Thermoproteota archaeon]